MNFKYLENSRTQKCSSMADDLKYNFWTLQYGDANGRTNSLFNARRAAWSSVWATRRSSTTACASTITRSQILRYHWQQMKIVSNRVSNLEQRCRHRKRIPVCACAVAWGFINGTRRRWKVPWQIDLYDTLVPTQYRLHDCVVLRHACLFKRITLWNSVVWGHASFPFEVIKWWKSVVCGHAYLFKCVTL